MSHWANASSCKAKAPSLLPSLLPSAISFRISRAAAIVAAVHATSKKQPFSIDSSTFNTFLFLDDDLADISLRTTMTLQTDVASVASRRDEQSGWTTHTEMRARLHELVRHRTLEIADAQRSSRHVQKESFYSTIGNNYQGEFRTAQESWVHAEQQVLSRIEFEHMSTEPFLRASAWLDACNQTGILRFQLDVNAASCMSPEFIGRPYFAASIESYEVTGQPHCNAPASLSPDAHPAYRE